MKASFHHVHARQILQCPFRAPEQLPPLLNRRKQSDRRVARDQYARALLRRSDSLPSVPDRERVQVALMATHTKPIPLPARRRVLPRLRGPCVPGPRARVGSIASAIQAWHVRFRETRSIAQSRLYLAPALAADRSWLSTSFCFRILRTNPVELLGS